MSLLKVAQMGHPVLIQRSSPVDLEELASPAMQRLIDDMIETVFDAPGVGLAAPQVYVSKRLFLMDARRSEDVEPRMEVVVNPRLEFPDDEKMELWEGCLSIPGVRGLTERFASVDLHFVDRRGQDQTMELRDFPAAIAQHENDHLDGIFFFARIPDLRYLSFEEEFSRHQGGEDPEPLA